MRCHDKTTSLVSRYVIADCFYLNRNQPKALQRLILAQTASVLTLNTISHALHCAKFFIRPKRSIFLRLQKIIQTHPSTVEGLLTNGAIVCGYDDLIKTGAGLIGIKQSVWWIAWPSTRLVAFYLFLFDARSAPLFRQLMGSTCWSWETKG